MNKPAAIPSFQETKRKREEELQVGKIVGLKKRKRHQTGLGKKSPRCLVKLKETSFKGMKPDYIFDKKDVLSQVVDFLDLRSLYKFAVASKSCMEILQPYHVVRAALYRGGHAKTNLERILCLLRSKKILVPSPMRLLRLCVGKYCEHCQDRRVNYVSKYFGVFFCKDCLERGGFVRLLRRNDCSLHSNLSHLYVIPEGFYGIQIWAKPYRDNLGNRCGPLLSLECRLKSGEAHQQDLFILRKKDKIRRSNHLKIMEMTYRQHLDAANECLLTNRLQKYLASIAAQERRNQRIAAMIEALHEELGEVPWKAVLLSHEWVQTGSRDQIDFLVPLAREVLSETVVAPSKATRSKVKGLSKTFIRYMAVFEESCLHDFSSFSYNPGFMNLCLSRFPRYSLLSCPWVNIKMLEFLGHLNHQTRAMIVSYYLSRQLEMENDHLRLQEINTGRRMQVSEE